MCGLISIFCVYPRAKQNHQVDKWYVVTLDEVLHAVQKRRCTVLLKKHLGSFPVLWTNLFSVSLCPLQLWLLSQHQVALFYCKHKETQKYKEDWWHHMFQRGHGLFSLKLADFERFDTFRYKREIRIIKDYKESFETLIKGDKNTPPWKVANSTCMFSSCATWCHCCNRGWKVERAGVASVFVCMHASVHIHSVCASRFMCASLCVWMRVRANTWLCVCFCVSASQTAIRNRQEVRSQLCGQWG